MRGVGGRSKRARGQEATAHHVVGRFRAHFRLGGGLRGSGDVLRCHGERRDGGIVLGLPFATPWLHCGEEMD